MYISEALVQKHQRRGPKQTGKFLTVLRMFPPTVSSHECWVADCSRYEGRRRQMICRPVQFLYVERRASKY